MRRRWLTGAAVLVVLGLVAGCQGGEDEPPPQIEVSGDFGTRPLVSVPEGYTVAETTEQVLLVGDGPIVQGGQIVLLDYLGIDLASEAVEVDTYATLPEIRTMTVDSLGAPLHDLLDGQTEGSRLQRIELGTADDPAPHLLLVDIRPTRAVGEEATVDEDMPTVELDSSGAPTVTIPDLAPPANVESAALITGTGPQVAPGESVVIQLLGVRWSDGSVLDTTWGSAPRAASLQDLGTGLSAGLVEQRVGSQVLVVVPPDQGNGVDTIVYVVDILATSDVELPPAGTEGQTS